MVSMKKRKLTEENIDDIITKEAEDLTKWDEPTLVKSAGATSIRLSPEMVRKAKYLAKIHKFRGYQTWLKQIIEDRIRIEEEILTELRQEFSKDTGR